MCPESLFGEVFLLTRAHVFEYQLEIGVLAVALEEAQEDVDSQPGIMYVVMQCCGCWCVYLQI